MSSNPITDKTLGKPSPNWDDSGFAEVRQKLGLAPEVPQQRGKSKKAKPAPQEYPTGTRLIGKRVESNGFSGDLLLRVVDSYEDPERAKCRYVVVENAEFKQHDWMKGHIFELRLPDSERYYRYWFRYHVVMATNTPVSAFKVSGK